MNPEEDDNKRHASLKKRASSHRAGSFENGPANESEGRSSDIKLDHCEPAQAMTPKSCSDALLFLVDAGRRLRRHHVSAQRSFTIGRGQDCDYYVPDPLCSRRHARLFVEKGDWHIQDLGSRNGVLVNGSLVNGSQRLSSQDTICLGPNTSLLFVIESGDERDASLNIEPDFAPLKGNKRVFTWIPEKKVRGVLPSQTLAADAFRADALRKAGIDHCPIEELYTLSIRLNRLAVLGDVEMTDDVTLAKETLGELLRLTGAQGGGLVEVHSGRSGRVIHEAGCFDDRSAIPDLVRSVWESGLTVCQRINDGASNRKAEQKQEAEDDVVVCAPVEWDFPQGGEEPVEYKRTTVAALLLHGPGMSMHDADVAALAAKSFATSWHSLEDRKRESKRLQRQQKKKIVDAFCRSSDFVGQAPAIRKVKELIWHAAPTDERILITGETGVGKEVLARQIHRLSNRSSERFLAVNCAAMKEHLVESQLFGHEKGAFTGADRRREGIFEAASGGTLFLDEIGDMSKATQAKLLRVLEEHTITRIGAHDEISIDVRVIAATSRDVGECMLEDLFYRLAVVPIELPSLRERREDVPLLAHRLLQQMPLAKQRSIYGFTDEAQEFLKAQDWPGNVRQLQNFIRRAIIFLPESEHLIGENHAREFFSTGLEMPDERHDRGGVLIGFRRFQAKRDLEYVAAQLEVSRTKRKAAEAMEMSREALSRMIQRHFEQYPELLNEPSLGSLGESYSRGKNAVAEE